MRRSTVPAVALILLLGLTGCARQGLPDSATRTVTVAPAASTAVPLDGVAQDLSDVDGAVSRAESEVSAGDAAASQCDAP